VLGVGLVVERRDLAVTRGAVQGDGLGQRPVGFELDGEHLAGRRSLFKLGQQTAAETQAADGRGDPHPLDVGGRAGRELDATAADGLVVQRGHQEQARGRGQLLLAHRAAGRVEAAVKAAGYLTEVGLQAESGVRMARIPLGHLDRGGRQQPLGLRHRRRKPGALPGIEPAEDDGRRRIGPFVEYGPLRQPGGRQPNAADPPVGPARLDHDETIALQRAQQPAQIARVQVQPRPQLPHVTAVRPDLPQQAGLAERALPGQERVAQHADPLGNGPVEAPDLAHHRLVHLSDLSQVITPGRVLDENVVTRGRRRRQGPLAGFGSGQALARPGGSGRKHGELPAASD